MKTSQKAKLGNICTIKTGKLDSNAAVEGGEYPFFTCAQGTFSIDKFAFDTEAVLLGGNNANGIFPLKYYQGKFNAYQRTYIIESKDRTKVLNKFIYFSLRPVLDYFKSASIGAATQYLTKPLLDNLKISLPDVDTQQSIIDIVYAYDDLIDINRRRIQLLEESARLLFREWFVYFSFPGHEKVKIVDGVPEGWGKINFMDIISTIESGGRPKGGAIDEGIPSIGAENVNGIGNYNYSNEKYVPDGYYQKMKKGKVISEDVLLYKDGANIGRTTIVGYGFPHNKCCVNEHVFILRTKNNIQNWLYFFLSQDFIRQAVANLNSNSAQPGISQDKLYSLKIIFPEQKIVRLFNDVAENIVKQIFILSIQNQKLAQARDLLLPRLMSGAIEV